MAGIEAKNTRSGIAIADHSDAKMEFLRVFNISNNKCSIDINGASRLEVTTLYYSNSYDVDNSQIMMETITLPVPAKKNFICKDFLSQVSTFSLGKYFLTHKLSNCNVEDADNIVLDEHSRQLIEHRKRKN